MPRKIPKKATMAERAPSPMRYRFPTIQPPLSIMPHPKRIPPKTRCQPNGETTAVRGILPVEGLGTIRYIMNAKPRVAMKRPTKMPCSKRVSRNRKLLLIAETKQKRDRCRIKPKAKPKTQKSAKRGIVALSQKKATNAPARAKTAAHGFHP